MAQRGERRAARASQHFEARAHEPPERRHRRGGEGIERLFVDDLALQAVALGLNLFCCSSALLVAHDCNSAATTKYTAQYFVQEALKNRK